MYSEQQIKDAFRRDFYERNRTFIGWVDEYFWWKNPNIKCQIQKSPTKSKPRCKVACPNCIRETKGVVAI